jgi:uncharacterized protein (TIGR00251 family)
MLSVAAAEIMSYFTESAEGVILNVKAQPRSSKSGIDGLLGDAVKVRIKCTPVDGKANKELTETLADAFGLPKSMVMFKSGETSKTKRILLKGVDAVRVRSVVKA